MSEEMDNPLSDVAMAKSAVSGAAVTCTTPAAAAAAAAAADSRRSQSNLGGFEKDSGHASPRSPPKQAADEDAGVIAAFGHNFMGHAPVWYKLIVIGASSRCW